VGWAERSKKNQGGGPRTAPKVLICIPSVDHTVTVPIMHLIATLMRDAPTTFHLPKSLCGKRTIAEPRNRLLARFRETGDNPEDALWFIDADVIPSNNTARLFPHLADPAIDIWGGIYPLVARGSGETDPLDITWTMYDEKDGHFIPAEPDESKDLQEVGGLGTGCMFIRRRVLDDPALHLTEDFKGVPCVFQTTHHPDGSVNYSDDLDFCLRARKAGYRIWANPHVKWGHRKAGDVRDSFELGAAAFAAGYQHRQNEEERDKPRIVSA
jgi:hypothetical protein